MNRRHKDHILAFERHSSHLGIFVFEKKERELEFLNGEICELLHENQRLK